MPAARLLHLAAADAPPDADLLGRFVAARDGAAFAELVRRHGPAVLAVCRRVTTHAHDAEDAFQATFLALARKAHRVRRGEPVAAWLYGVAVRAARKAAGRAFRRRARETLVADLPDVPGRPAEPFDPDAARAVAEEVGRLSAAYRAAVVLCELEGRSRAAAARELGIAEGTLSSRLAAARRQLARRLAARGFAPAALATLVGVAVPPRLATAAAGPPPPGVEVLTRGVIRAMSAEKLKAVPLVVAAVAGGLVIVAGLAAAPPAAAPAPPAAPARVAADGPRPARPAPDRRPKGPNRLFVACHQEIIRFDQDGAEQRPFPEAEDCINYLALSWDGKRVAGIVTPNPKNPGDPYPPPRLYVRELGADAPRTDLGETDMRSVVAWSGDGTALVLVGWDLDERTAPGTRNVVSNVRNVVMDVTTGDVTAIPLPDHHYVLDWSRDGRFFLVEHDADRDPSSRWPPSSLWLAGRDGVKQRRVADGTIFLPSLSADGARVVMGVANRAPPDPPGRDTNPAYLRNSLAVVEIAAGTTTPVRNVSPHARIDGVCWSPDGRHIAYVWRDMDPNNPATPPRGTLFYVTVCEPDGSNPRIVFKRIGEEPDETAMSRVSWR